jgi:putative hydrolase of the HAD superfamily
MPAPIEAVFWDFGGVITTSPFEAFARHERETGLPDGFIRRVNATGADDNAWAKLERNEVDVDAFCRLFEAEARALGGTVDGRAVLRLLAGEPRPEMVAALRAVARDYRTACLTNNVRGPARTPESAARITEIMAIFDVVVESSKVGVRKPEPRFYEIACELVGVAPGRVVFLDDLGVNLKPARAMGMRTIKVVSPAQAIADLEAALGRSLS